MATKKEKPPETPGMVETKAVANLFGLTVRRIQQLTQDGIIKTTQTPAGRRYELLGTVRAYVAYLQERAAGRAEKSKATEKEEEKLDAEIDLKRSKARMAQLELEELEGKMHRSEDVEAMTTDLCLAIRSMLMALPGQLSVDLVGVETAAEISIKIKNAIHDILGELANYQYDPKEYRRRVRDRQGWKEKHGEDLDE
jgi:phage terminase Nu1 subunit (DNA packaging protein)